jgi:hypothetical protein
VELLGDSIVEQQQSRQNEDDIAASGEIEVSYASGILKVSRILGKIYYLESRG